MQILSKYTSFPSCAYIGIWPKFQYLSWPTAYLSTLFPGFLVFYHSIPLSSRKRWQQHIYRFSLCAYCSTAKPPGRTLALNCNIMTRAAQENYAFILLYSFFLYTSKRLDHKNARIPFFSHSMRHRPSYESFCVMVCYCLTQSHDKFVFFFFI